ncbi:hypothetical protein GQ457_02G011150 [Hibiscus cannabinus]
MNQNMSSLLIGVVGAAITLSAYSQTMVSPTQCVTVGLFVLMFGLLVREGSSISFPMVNLRLIWVDFTSQNFIVLGLSTNRMFN